MNVEDPAVVGVPPITPAAERVSPAGREPELVDQVYGDVPPVAFICVLYAWPTVPFGTLVVTMPKGAGGVPPPVVLKNSHMAGALVATPGSKVTPRPSSVRRSTLSC